jgi:predicted transcriptional regulator of viral defense system
MKGLSDKEIEIIAYLEFDKKYFFTRKDISSFFKSYNQTRHTIHKLIQKERIISLNRNKYYLIPIKAKTGKWCENPFILADEIFNGKNYYIGGWAAANYWNLTEQVPFWIEVYSTKRQGKKIMLSNRFIFRRTSKKRIKTAITKNSNGHNFKIMNIEEMKDWMKLRN